MYVTKSLRVSNVGEQDLNILGVGNIDTTNFRIINEDRQFTIRPGYSQNINIRFSPTQKESFIDTLTIRHNPGKDVKVVMTGTGRDSLRQNITVNPDTINYNSRTVPSDCATVWDDCSTNCWEKK